MVPYWSNTWEVPQQDCAYDYHHHQQHKDYSVRTAFAVPANVAVVVAAVVADAVADTHIGWAHRRDYYTD